MEEGEGEEEVGVRWGGGDDPRLGGVEVWEVGVVSLRRKPTDQYFVFQHISGRRAQGITSVNFLV